MEVGTVTLETERLILRRFQESDVEGVYKNWGHQKELYKFLPWEAHKDIEDTLNIVRRWIARYEEPYRYQWCIELKEKKESIGAIWLSNYKEESKSIATGFCIGSDYRAKEYCTEALKRIVQYMKEINSKRIREIRGTNDVNNPASGKVFQNAGFTFYGIEYRYSESLKKNVDMSVWNYKL